MKKAVGHLLRQVAERCFSISIEVLNERNERALEIGRTLLVAWSHESEFVCLCVGIRNQFCPVDFHDGTQSVTTLPGSITVVKLKQPRLKGRDVYPTVHARQCF